jgi:uncharacterized protein (TIGR03546 family)
MFRMLGRAAQRLLTEISQHRTPEQIAWGLAIGVSFGLVPMDSIISVLLLIAILILPVNHLCAAIAFVSMALVSRFVAPIPNTLGLWILSHPWVVNSLSVVYSYPLVPWLRLNNTMVVGGFCLGILSVAPNYITLRWLVRRTHSKIQQWSIDEAPEFRKISAEKSTRNPTLSPSVAQSHRSVPAPILATSTTSTQRATHGSHSECKPSDSPPLRHTTPEPTRIPAAVSAAINIAPAINASSASQDATKTSSRDSSPTVSSLGNTISAQGISAQGDTVLRETVIEVVRFREPLESGTVAQPLSSVSSSNRVHDIPIDSNALSGPHLTTETKNQELMIAEKNASLGSVSLKTHTGSPVDPNTGAIQPPSPIGLGNHRQAITGHKGSDSLRYLLRHITGTKTEREGTDS